MSPFSLRAEGSAEAAIMVLGVTPDALMIRSAEVEERRVVSDLIQGEARWGLTLDNGSILEFNLSLPSVRNLLVDAISENDLDTFSFELALQLARKLERRRFGEKMAK